MRYLLHILTALGLIGNALGAEESVRVGAIRWDAWYGENGPVEHVEHSLGQPKYHFRLTWFASVRADGKVSINGDSQAIMQAELNYAAAAGLDYWAFLDYGPGAPMPRALDRYLAADDKRGMSYCFIEEGGQIDARGRRIGHG